MFDRATVLKVSYVILRITYISVLQFNFLCKKLPDDGKINCRNT